jgi:hypothetical protein
LIDEDATQENIRDGLKWLRDSVKERDAGVIFLAGTRHVAGQFILLRSLSCRATSARMENWVPGNEIVNTLAESARAGNVLP